ncbi:MBL fold metallo-hydrolase [Streptomyces sp. MS06]|uniref:MBL fold metallo-hydrolase n=1 Tax=Streptomyces sp. MS06 TaxID=3385974 RepID=UPI0039A23492
MDPAPTTEGNLDNSHRTRDWEKMNCLLDHIPGIIGNRDPKTWYKTEAIDPQTIAIREYRYYQHNIHYLIMGTERAILLDTGPGLSDISAVTSQLTRLPVTALATHGHYDHIGNLHLFERIAAADIPAIREHCEGDEYHSTFHSSVSARRRAFTVTEWLDLSKPIDLGGRQLTIRHTPGHTNDSISLHDPDRGYLFTGDFICPLPNVFGKILMGTSLPDAVASARMLATEFPESRVFGGHTGFLPPRSLQDTHEALEEAAEWAEHGSGIMCSFQKGDMRIIASK